ncbi:MAG: copper oxidase [Betaproteobacteria bacterium]|nr:copper oxidase [Betaproteobacteria bacterium]
MTTRREFLRSSGAGLIGAALVSRAQAASLPEAPTRDRPGMAPPLEPASGPPYRPVLTLNGWSLPWRMNAGWKEFHLVAEPVVREIAPGMQANLWGYNGQSPGPTIECVEGDRLRIFVTNRLPEHTTVHWHGVLLPNGMDGVGGLTQPQIPPGKTFVYEFQMKHSGTFMYHPHADEMVQMAMGMMGAIVVHPRNPAERRVDRDFVFLMNAFLIEPGARTPSVAEMTDFNLWCWNSRVFPGIDHLPVRLGDRVRIRIGNLTMTNHPIHIHGHAFKVSCTDGGWVPEGARWPETTIDMPVGALRAIEFVADNPGVPDYMAMGERGMADMGAMEMPLPENTLPMMSGTGPFGALEMGGMFTVVKVREGLGRDDYKDPGWYRHPAGTLAYEWKGEAPDASRKEPGNAETAQYRAVKSIAGTHGH